MCLDCRIYDLLIFASFSLNLGLNFENFVFLGVWVNRHILFFGSQKLFSGEHPYQIDSWVPPLGCSLLCVLYPFTKCVISLFVESGEVYCWGSGRKGQLGIEAGLLSPVQTPNKGTELISAYILCNTWTAPINTIVILIIHSNTEETSYYPQRLLLTVGV